jgi:tetratricopeptide (TPR) repeat protein
LGTTEGFVLVPVELSGIPGARRLHRWLRQHGHPLQCELVETDIVGKLVGRTTGLIVAGPSPGTENEAGILRLLNQRRDAVSRPPFPVLWCGPCDWLAFTWQHAPDFWSVRAHARTLDPEPPGPEWARPVWAGPAVEDEPDRLSALRDAARDQGDRLNAARLGYALAASEAARGQLAGAAEAITAAIADVPAGSDPELLFDLRLLGARLALAAGERRAVRGWLAAAAALAGGSVGKQAQVGLIAAQSELAGGRAVRAIAIYSGLLQGLGDRPLLGARARVGLGRSLMAARELKGAEPVLRDAVALFQAQGEILGEATALYELGEICRRTGRLAEARDLLNGALDAFVDNGLTEPAERTHELLALVELADGRPDDAVTALVAAGAQAGDAPAARRRLLERAVKARGR